jgi:molybdate transport system ATP-binding protein
LTHSHGSADEAALVEASVADHDEEFGLTTLHCAAGHLRAPHLALPVGTTVVVRIRARDVMIGIRPPDGISALNVLPGRVLALRDTDTNLVNVELDCGGIRLMARLTRKSVETLALRKGVDVFAILKSVTLDSEALARAPRPDRPIGADASATSPGYR